MAIPTERLPEVEVREAQRLTIVSPVESEPEYDLGVPEYMAAKMRANIVGNHDLPPSGRDSNEIRKEQWTKESLVEYGEWLCHLLEVDAKDVGATHFSRASKFGLGPSTAVVKRIYGKGGVTELKQDLGDEDPHLKFMHVTNDELVERGTRFANNLGRRPTTADLDDARSQGILPGDEGIRGRFGKHTVFYEQIGRPSLKGGSLADYVDWGVAYKRKNGLGQPMTAPLLGILSKRGVGPQASSIYKLAKTTDLFSNLKEFDQLVTRECIARLEAEERLQAKRGDANVGPGYRFQNADLSILLGDRLPEVPVPTPAKDIVVPTRMPMPTPVKQITPSRDVYDDDENLRRYRREIAAYALLTKAEEATLGATILAGKNAQWRLDQGIGERGDKELARAAKEAKGKFVVANLRLVVSVANREIQVEPLVPGENLLDLIQEGNFGLMTAVEKFDHRKGFKFSTHATWWIRQAIQKHRSKSIHIPRKVRDNTSAARGQQEEDRKAGKTPEPLTGLLADAYKAMEVGSLNHRLELDDKEGSELGDLLPDKDTVSPETAAVENQALFDAMSILDYDEHGLPRATANTEKKILYLRHLADPNVSLANIAHRLDIPIHRITKMYKEAKAILETAA